MTERITDYGNPRWLRELYLRWILSTPEGQRHLQNRWCKWVESWFPQITDWHLEVHPPQGVEI